MGNIITINEDGIKMPGLSINEDGIRMPGLSINENGIRMPGMNISQDGTYINGVKYESKNGYVYIDGIQSDIESKNKNLSISSYNGNVTINGHKYNPKKNITSNSENLKINDRSIFFSTTMVLSGLVLIYIGMKK